MQTIYLCWKSLQILHHHRYNKLFPLSLCIAVRYDIDLHNPTEDYVNSEIKFPPLPYFRIILLVYSTRAKGKIVWWYTFNRKSIPVVASMRCIIKKSYKNCDALLIYSDDGKTKLKNMNWMIYGCRRNVMDGKILFILIGPLSIWS